MKVFYLPNGEIWNVVLARDVAITNIEPTAQSIEVDEIASNTDLVIDMLSHSALKDENKNGKWYVFNGELYERDGWTPAIPPLGGIT